MTVLTLTVPLMEERCLTDVSVVVMLFPALWTNPVYLAVHMDHGRQGPFAFVATLGTAQIHFFFLSIPKRSVMPGVPAETGLLCAKAKAS